MAATVEARWYGGSPTEPSGTSAETGTRLNRSDALADATATIPIPSPGPGTAFGWFHLFALYVSGGGGSTNIFNRTVRLTSSPPAGVGIYFRERTTYLQPTALNAPADTALDGSVPATYAALTTTAASYHPASVAAANGVRNGSFIELVLGVSSTYGGGPGPASFGSLVAGYDEA